MSDYNYISLQIIIEIINMVKSERMGKTSWHSPLDVQLELQQDTKDHGHQDLHQGRQ